MIRPARRKPNTAESLNRKPWLKVNSGELLFPNAEFLFPNAELLVPRPRRKANSLEGSFRNAESLNRRPCGNEDYGFGINRRAEFMDCRAFRRTAPTIRRSQSPV